MEGTGNSRLAYARQSTTELGLLRSSKLTNFILFLGKRLRSSIEMSIIDGHNGQYQSSNYHSIVPFQKPFIIKGYLIIESTKNVPFVLLPTKNGK